MSGAAKGPEFFPVKDMHQSYLGITVTTPGAEGWVVAEERYRRRIEQEPLSADDVSAAFVGALQFD